jgi:hypothetical protein
MPRQGWCQPEHAYLLTGLVGAERDRRDAEQQDAQHAVQGGVAIQSELVHRSAGVLAQHVRGLPFDQ